MGTHLRILSESYPINTNIQGLDVFQKSLLIVLWKKVALALERLRACRGPSINDFVLEN